MITLTQSCVQNNNDRIIAIFNIALKVDRITKTWKRIDLESVVITYNVHVHVKFLL